MQGTRPVDGEGRGSTPTLTHHIVLPCYQLLNPLNSNSVERGKMESSLVSRCGIQFRAVYCRAMFSDYATSPLIDGIFPVYNTL